MAVNNVCNEVPTISGTTNQIAVTQAAGTSTATIALASTVINTSQPMFSAYLSTNPSNVTGDGTVYTVICDTKFFDQGTNYNTSTGTFTAPATGKYIFSGSLLATNGGISATGLFLLAVTGISYTLDYSAIFTAALTRSFSGTVIVALTAGNTAQITFQATGSTKTTSLIGGNGPVDTYFCGALLV